MLQLALNDIFSDYLFGEKVSYINEATIKPTTPTNSRKQVKTVIWRTRRTITAPNNEKLDKTR